ncbi:hypothetical protein HIM_10353 [Hirsutella minnesotensis 3608]|uniref:Uncharacterized protein n=1 Tax=Hirsutella minnesotensis 3608 TaxID=1043627 RepID=A0A0F7ZX83_9HYPO|nr:hypothetical protein HIM_10353 [Hirsutella minnesotensis 3608]
MSSNSGYVRIAQSQDPECAASAEKQSELREAQGTWTSCLQLKFILSYVLVLLLGIIIGISFSLALAGPRRPWTQMLNNINLQKPVAGVTRAINGTQISGTQCGENWQQAKALGCHFDVMASRWYAPECFDKSVLDAMLQEQPYVNFTWYADNKHTKVYSSELVLRGEFDKVYPSGDYHIYHCLYLWRRLHHAVLNRKPVDEDLLKYGHTLHCTRMIMRWMDPNISRTTISSAISGRPFCRSSRLGMLGG